MKREESILRRTLGDTEELRVEVDDQGIREIRGIAVVQGVSFSISISRSASGNTTPKREDHAPTYRYLYNGTISVLDPASTKVMLSEAKRRQKEEKGKPYQHKDVYASKKLRCDSAAPQVIANSILNKMRALIEENKSQLDQALMKAMTPDQLTLPFAVEQYCFDFLRRSFPKAPPEANNKRAGQLKRTLSKFPMTPIVKLNTRTVNSILKEIKASEECIRLCFLFVEYLLELHKYSGKNPFVLPAAREISKGNAFKQQELGDAVFTEMFRLLNKELSGMNVIIALNASGFPFEDIKQLTWDDIEFIKGYRDFGIVHIRREYAAVSKHDFSRPMILDSALFIHKVYKELKTRRPESLDDEKIWLDGLKNETVNNEIRNLLVRAGFAGSFSTPGRPDADQIDVPARILQTNYQRMLAAKCGLKDDPDTLSFLSGTMFRSSTYTNYESHTSPDAALRLYQILKPLSTEKKLDKLSGSSRTKGGMAVYEIWPKTNHEAARVTTKVRLKPGQSLSIRSEHGAHGIVRIHRARDGAGVRDL